MKGHIRTISFTIKQLKNIILQYYFAKKILKPLITDSTEKRLSTKIEIYATLVPLLTGHIYAEMMRISQTKDIKKLTTLISALMPVNDEFVDNLGYSRDYIDNFFNNFKNIKPMNQHERIQQILLLHIFDEAKHPQVIFQAIKQVHLAQLDSLRQKNSTNVDEISNITRNKGGYTALLYVKSVTPKIDKLIVDAMYQFGYWMQLVDDMLDKTENKKEGINTLATLLPAREFLDLLELNAKKMKQMIQSLELDKNKKEEFLFSCHYFIEITKAFFTDPNRDDHNYQTGLTRVLHHLSYTRKAYPKIVKFTY